MTTMTTEHFQPYRDFSPTAFDPKGLGLDDRQDWLVCGAVGQTRDSGPLQASNFDQFLAGLAEVDPEGNDHETHRFGHWGPGWFEIVIVRPESPAFQVARVLSLKLADYPVLDESDFSEREHESAMEAFSGRDAVDEIRRNIEVSDRLYGFLRDQSAGALLDLLSPDMTYDGDQPYYDVTSAARNLTRAQLARFVVAYRRGDL